MTQGDYTLLLATLLAAARRPRRRQGWERYRLREGQLVDRRRLRESPHYLQGLNFLVAGQTRPGHRGVVEGGRRARRGRSKCTSCSATCIARRDRSAAPSRCTSRLLQRPRLIAPGARLRAALPRPRLPAGGLRRPRARGIPRSAAPRSAQPRTPWPTSRSSTPTSTSGTTPTTSGSALRQASHPRTSRAATRRMLAFLENELGREALKKMDYAKAARRFEAAHRPRSKGRAGVPQSRRRALLRGRRGRRQPRRGNASSRSRPTAPISPSTGSRPSTRRWGRRTGSPTLCRRLIADSPQDWRARVALARHLATEGQAAATPSNCCSRRWPSTRTPSRCTGRRGRSLLQLNLDRALVERYIEREPGGGVLPGPARLPALPLPQHRAAVAVPALSRMEHVRGRAAHAAHDDDACRADSAIAVLSVDAARRADRRHRDGQELRPRPLRGPRRCQPSMPTRSRATWWPRARRACAAVVAQLRAPASSIHAARWIARAGGHRVPDPAARGALEVDRPPARVRRDRALDERLAGRPRARASQRRRPVRRRRHPAAVRDGPRGRLRRGGGRLLSTRAAGRRGEVARDALTEARGAATARGAVAHRRRRCGGRTT